MKLPERSSRLPPPPKAIEVLRQEQVEESELDTLIQALRGKHKEVMQEFKDLGDYFNEIGYRLELFPEDEGCWEQPSEQRGWTEAEKEIQSIFASPAGGLQNEITDIKAINVLRMFPSRKPELKELLQVYLERLAYYLARPIDHLLKIDQISGDELSGLITLSLYDDRGPEFWREQGRKFIQPSLQKIRAEGDE